jgi:hypothetical protein
MAKTRMQGRRYAMRDQIRARLRCCRRRRRCSCCLEGRAPETRVLGLCRVVCRDAYTFRCLI